VCLSTTDVIKASRDVNVYFLTVSGQFNTPSNPRLFQGWREICRHFGPRWHPAQLQVVVTPAAAGGFNLRLPFSMKLTNQHPDCRPVYIHYKFINPWKLTFLIKIGTLYGRRQITDKLPGQSSSWSRNSPFFMKHEIHFRVHKSTQLYHILGQFDTVHTLTHYFVKILFNIIFQTTPPSTAGTFYTMSDVRHACVYYFYKSCHSNASKRFSTSRNNDCRTICVLYRCHGNTVKGFSDLRFAILKVY
jgi:hypothetical protein